MNNHVAIFSRLIRTQLLQHNRVSLPGLGSFIAEDQPSKIMDDGRLISPPTRVITFSVKETWNDEILERAYATELEGSMLELEDEERNPSKLFLEQAKKEVAQFVLTVESQLRSSGVFHFPDLGVMKMEGRRREISFFTSPDSDLAPRAFGLTPLSIKPLSSPSKLQKSIPPAIKPQKIEKPKGTGETKKAVSMEKKKLPKSVKNTDGVKKRTPKWLLAVLGVLVAIVLLLLLVYVFREELKPLLERVLYTPAEREILRTLQGT